MSGRRPCPHTPRPVMCACSAAYCMRCSGFLSSHHLGAFTLTRGMSSTFGFTLMRESVRASNAVKSSPSFFQISGMPYETKSTPASAALRAVERSVSGMSALAESGSCVWTPEGPTS